MCFNLSVKTAVMFPPNQKVMFHCTEFWLSWRHEEVFFSERERFCGVTLLSSALLKSTVLAVKVKCVRVLEV